MYEMEGALPGYATPSPPADRQTPRHAPPAGTGDPPEAPVSRRLPRPGGRPGRFPFPTVKYFYCFPRRRARVCGNSFLVFPRPHDIHRTPVVIRMLPDLSTGLCTTHPQATHCNSASTDLAVAKCNQVGFPGTSSRQLMFRSNNGNVPGIHVGGHLRSTVSDSRRMASDDSPGRPPRAGESRSG